MSKFLGIAILSLLSVSVAVQIGDEDNHAAHLVASSGKPKHKESEEDKKEPKDKDSEEGKKEQKIKEIEEDKKESEAAKQKKEEGKKQGEGKKEGKEGEKESKGGNKEGKTTSGKQCFEVKLPNGFGLGRTTMAVEMSYTFYAGSAFKALQGALPTSKPVVPAACATNGFTVAATQAHIDKLKGIILKKTGKEVSGDYKYWEQKSGWR